MKIIEIQTRIATINGELTMWKDLLAKKKCLDCVYFQRNPMCSLANAVPPADVQAVGCPAWEWDEIPFN